METNKIIGENIKKCRDKLGYSQEEIASYLDIDRTLISRYENGTREIGLLHLNKLADLYCLDVEDFVDDKLMEKAEKIAFAFRKEELDKIDIESISKFQKVVKNYISMIEILENDR